MWSGRRGTGGRIWRSVVVALALLAVGAGTAGARWHPPIQIAAHGLVANGWLDDQGIFRTVGDRAGQPHLTTVTSSGLIGPGASESYSYSIPLRGQRTLAVRGGGSVRLTVLSKGGSRLRTYSLRGALPDAVFGFGFSSRSVVPLANGGAMVCTDLGGLRGERVAVVSPGGLRIHAFDVRGGRGAAALSLPDGGCFGADAAPATSPAGVLFENGNADQGSGATDAQVMIERLLPGPRLGPAIALAPMGQAFTENAGEPDVAETSRGWIAVSWLESHQQGDLLMSREDLRWLSPTDVLGPVIHLSSPTASYPAAVALAAVGDRSVIALINPEDPDTRIYSERIDAPGTVARRHTLFAGPKIVPPRMATNGHRIVATWLADQSVRTADWSNGRWTRPTLIKRCNSISCPDNPNVTISRNGLAAVYFSIVGVNPFARGGEVAFDF